MSKELENKIKTWKHERIKKVESSSVEFFGLVLLIDKFVIVCMVYKITYKYVTASFFGIISST